MKYAAEVKIFHLSRGLFQLIWYSLLETSTYLRQPKLEESNRALVAFFFHDSEPAPVSNTSIANALMKTERNLRVLKNVNNNYNTNVNQPPLKTVAVNTTLRKYKN